MKGLTEAHLKLPSDRKIARAQEVRWKEKKKRQIILNQPEKEKERGRNKL